MVDEQTSQWPKSQLNLKTKLPLTPRKIWNENVSVTELLFFSGGYSDENMQSSAFQKYFDIFHMKTEVYGFFLGGTLFREHFQLRILLNDKLISPLLFCSVHDLSFSCQLPRFN